MRHELVVDEAHDTVPKEKAWEMLAQQDISDQCLKPAVAQTMSALQAVQLSRVKCFKLQA